MAQAIIHWLQQNSYQSPFPTAEQINWLDNLVTGSRTIPLTPQPEGTGAGGSGKPLDKYAKVNAILDKGSAHFSLQDIRASYAKHAILSELGGECVPDAKKTANTLFTLQLLYICYTHDMDDQSILSKVNRCFRFFSLISA